MSATEDDLPPEFAAPTDPAEREAALIASIQDRARRVIAFRDAVGIPDDADGDRAAIELIRAAAARTLTSEAE